MFTPRSKALPLLGAPDDPLAASSVLPPPAPLAPPPLPEVPGSPLEASLSTLPLEREVGCPAAPPVPVPMPAGTASVLAVPQAQMPTAKHMKTSLLDLIVRSQHASFRGEACCIWHALDARPVGPRVRVFLGRLGQFSTSRARSSPVAR